MFYSQSMYVTILCYYYYITVFFILYGDVMLCAIVQATILCVFSYYGNEVYVSAHSCDTLIIDWDKLYLLPPVVYVHACVW